MDRTEARGNLLNLATKVSEFLFDQLAREMLRIDLGGEFSFGIVCCSGFARDGRWQNIFGQRLNMLCQTSCRADSNDQNTFCEWIESSGMPTFRGRTARSILLTTSREVIRSGLWILRKPHFMVANIALKRHVSG